MHQLGDLFDKARFVDHVGDFADHNAALALRHGLDLAAGAGNDLAAAGGVGLVYARLAHDDAAGGEVGALDKLHQLLGRGIGMIQHVYARVDRLAQIVRRDVGGHADRDARGTVD